MNLLIRLGSAGKKEKKGPLTSLLQEDRVSKAQNTPNFREQFRVSARKFGSVVDTQTATPVSKAKAWMETLNLHLVSIFVFSPLFRFFVSARGQVF